VLEKKGTSQERSLEDSLHYTDGEKQGIPEIYFGYLYAIVEKATLLTRVMSPLATVAPVDALKKRQPQRLLTK